MARLASLALAFPLALVASACRPSSSGDHEDPRALEIQALRNELALARVEPLPEAPPVDPPVSPELFALGQALFFDKILSGNQDISCATCHLPDFGTSDGRTLSDGIHGIGLGPNRGGGAMIPRNSPGLFNLQLKRELFWDGRVREIVQGVVAVPPAVDITPQMRLTFSRGLELLAAQAMLPPVSREEMRGLMGENDLGDVGDGYNSNHGTSSNTTRVWHELTERLLATPGYARMLREAYPDELAGFGFEHAANAIAAFEARAFARMDSPLQRFLLGDDTAITRKQVLGGLEFFRAGCANCHSGRLFTDQQFHNIGLPQLGPGVSPVATPGRPGWDLGRENVTGDPRDHMRFRTPSLLNVTLTAPYGHAGQFAELRDFVAHYRDVELSNLQYDIQSNVSDPALVTMLVPHSELVLATLDPELPRQNDFDVDAVVDFLRALTAYDALYMPDVVPASVPSGLPIF